MVAKRTGMVHFAISIRAGVCVTMIGEEENAMKHYNRMINEILGQLYQEERLCSCLQETIKIHPERIRILHDIVMNIDCLSKEEMREKIYCYARSIEEDELLARQIFLCLLYLENV